MLKYERILLHCLGIYYAVITRIHRRDKKIIIILYCFISDHEPTFKTNTRIVQRINIHDNDTESINTRTNDLNTIYECTGLSEFRETYPWETGITSRHVRFQCRFHYFQVTLSSKSKSLRIIFTKSQFHNSIYTFFFFENNIISIPIDIIYMFLAQFSLLL